MKQKQLKNGSAKLSRMSSQAGFTIVELLAVMAIMTLLLGALVIDFAGQRANRNIVLAKNETATGLRKVQNYMLSSKNLANGQAVKYYIATFTSGSTSYTVDAVDSNYNFYSNIETIKLPTQVKISEIRTVNLSGPGSGFYPESGSGDGKVTNTYTSHNCMQIIFSAPFGKIYSNGASSCGSSIKDVVRDPVQRAALSEKTAQIFFAKASDSTGTAYLEIVPVTGQMTAY